jgi:hypothetical protein
VLANGSMSSQQSGEGEIRKALVEADLVDCMVALPGQLFYSTQIPVCLWFLARDKKNGLGGRGKKMRNRHHETLFIDARKLGTLVDRVHRELTDADIARIADTYHAGAETGLASTRTCPASARARGRRRSPRTSSCSRRALRRGRGSRGRRRALRREDEEAGGDAGGAVRGGGAAGEGDPDTRAAVYVKNLMVPSIEEQRAIAGILGTLDDKIELNRRTNETLEAMASALFKSWFVDFDPVRAKAAGKKPSGMDAETAALFPSELVESEMGDIPKGWPLGSLGTVMELKRGYDLPQGDRREGQVPIVSSGGHSGFHHEAMARAPGIVTGRYGTIGRVFLVREDFWPSTRPFTSAT